MAPRFPDPLQSLGVTVVLGHAATSEDRSRTRPCFRGHCVLMPWVARDSANAWADRFRE